MGRMAFHLTLALLFISDTVNYILQGMATLKNGWQRNWTVKAVAESIIRIRARWALIAAVLATRLGCAWVHALDALRAGQGQFSPPQGLGYHLSLDIRFNR